MMEIKGLNRKSLSAYIESEAYQKAEVVPISYHRALSHIRNPRAYEDDVLLYLAIDGGQLLGYLGILPDDMYPDGNQVHFGWLSCLWVDQNTRGQGVSRKLLGAAEHDWKGHLMVTEFTNVARDIYYKGGIFNDFQFNEGLRLYMQFDLHYILPPKKWIFRKTKGLLKLADGIGNSFRGALSRKNIQPEYSFEYAETLDTEMGNFIARFSGDELFQRGAEEWNWLLQNPWLKVGVPDGNSQRYFFSSVAASFRTLPVKVRDTDGKLVGALILQERDRRMKVLFCYCKEAYVRQMTEVVLYHIHEWQIITFTTYHPWLIKELKQTRIGAIYQKTVIRHYLKSKLFNEMLGDKYWTMQAGDGDCGFT